MRQRSRTVVGIVAFVAGLSMVPGVGLAQSSSTQGQSSSTQGQTSTQSGGGQSDVTIASDSLQGTKVYDSQGKELGSISKLMIDPKDGRVASVVIKHGGTAGVGGKEVNVPWNALKVQRGDRGLVATMQQEALERAPSASPSTDRDRNQPDRSQK
jgi:sporulation protein YlmC with PRC-barrel domain